MHIYIKYIITILLFLWFIGGVSAHYYHPHKPRVETVQSILEEARKYNYTSPVSRKERQVRARIANDDRTIFIYPYYYDYNRRVYDNYYYDGYYLIDRYYYNDHNNNFYRYSY